VVICLEQGADLHIVQLMPLPLTVSCSSKIQMGSTFLVPAHLGGPGKRAVKWVCVCMCTVIVFVHAILMHPAQVLGSNALYLSTRSFMNFTIMSVHKYCKYYNYYFRSIKYHFSSLLANCKQLSLVICCSFLVELEMAC